MAFNIECDSDFADRQARAQPRGPPPRYLAAALRIATDEGLHAVTMPRLAAELDCAVGTVYTYFPSKSALLAEVQSEAIERLSASYLALRADLDARAVDELTHVVAIGRFWIDISDTYPQETRLLQLLMSQADSAMNDEDALRVVPAALRHLDFARERFDAAAESGALAAGDAFARTVTFAAGINGVAAGRSARAGSHPTCSTAPAWPARWSTTSSSAGARTSASSPSPTPTSTTSPTRARWPA